MKIVTIALLAGIAAGCGRDSNDHSDSAGGEVGSPVEGAMIIGLSEWKIESPMDTLPAGRYTFRVENTGSRQHALDIEGNGKEWETGDIRPGGASELTVELEPGTYELYCPVEEKDVEHDDRGMKRKIVVKAA